MEAGWGRARFLKINSAVRYRPADLEAWLQRDPVAAASQRRDASLRSPLVQSSRLRRVHAKLDTHSVFYLNRVT